MRRFNCVGYSFAMTALLALFSFTVFANGGQAVDQRLLFLSTGIFENASIFQRHLDDELAGNNNYLALDAKNAAQKMVQVAFHFKGEVEKHVGPDHLARDFRFMKVNFELMMTSLDRMHYFDTHTKHHSAEMTKHFLNELQVYFTSQAH